MGGITRVIFILTFSCLALSSFCHAKQLGLEKFVSKNCAAFVVIEEPDEFLQSFELLVFSNPRICRGFEILQDGEDPLIDQAGINQFERGWSQLKNNLAQLNEVSIVIHQNPGLDADSPALRSDFWTGVFPKFSIILNGPPHCLQTIEQMLKSGQSQATEQLSELRLSQQEENELIQGPVVTDGEHEKFEETELVLFADHLKSFLDGLSVERSGDVVVISNDEENSSQLLSRVNGAADKKFRSLSLHRSYQVVQKLLERCSPSTVVRGFFVPENFPEYTTELVTESLGFHPTALRASGFVMSLMPDAATVEVGEDVYRSVVEWDFVMTFTRPATEYGKIVESFLPIEDPPALLLPVSELRAFGFDSKLRHEAFMETIQIHHVEDDTSDDFNPVGDHEVYGIISESKKFAPDTVSNFSNSRFEAWVADPNDGVNRWLEMYPVGDPDTMDLFFQSRIEAENRVLEPRDWFVEMESDYGRLYARTSAAIRARAKELIEDGFGEDLSFELPASGPLPDNYMCREEEFFLDDQWMICTDHTTMRSVLKALYEETPAPSKLKHILEASRKRIGERVPVKIDYASIEHEEKSYMHSQLFYLREKYLAQDQEEVFNEIIAAGPDEFGLYGTLESKYEAYVAASQLIGSGLVETFGTKVVLSSSDQYNFRVFGQYYSKVDSE